MIIDSATSDLIRAVEPTLRLCSTPPEPEDIDACITRVSDRDCYPREADKLARIILEELGLDGALELANREFPPDPINSLFKSFRDEWETPGAPSPDPVKYLDLAATLGPNHEARFAGMLDVYVVYAPTRQPPREEVDHARTELVVRT